MDKQKLEDELEDLEILLPQLNSAYAEMQVEEFDDEEFHECDLEMAMAEIHQVERRIAIIKKRLTPLALDGGDSAPQSALSTPEVLSPSLSDSASRPAAQ